LRHLSGIKYVGFINKLTTEGIDQFILLQDYYVEQVSLYNTFSHLFSKIFWFISFDLF